MPYQLNEGQGSLFTNTYKNVNDPNDRSPHFKGHCLVNGAEKEIAGWWAYPQNGGQPYLQLKISDPRPRPQQGGYAPQQPQGAPQYPAAPQQPQQQQPQGGYQQRPQSPAPQQPIQAAYPQYQQQTQTQPAQEEKADDLPF
jgi:hypothetical protein